MRYKPSLLVLAAALALAPVWLASAYAQKAPDLQLPDLLAPELQVPELQVPESQAPELQGPEPQAPELATPESQPPESQAENKGDAVRPKPPSRDKLLEGLYANLAKAQDAQQADPIAKSIERLWLQSGSDTIGVLMGRSLAALNQQNPDLALRLLDAIVELAPDYAEGWNRRAYVYYLQNDYEHALGDLRRALALEPNHFKALEGLARIMREVGQKKSALQAYQQLQRIHPHLSGANEAVRELSLEVEGQGI